MITLDTFKDERGELYSFWKQDISFQDFVEDRFSHSTKGVIRGFHGDKYTGKLCSCIQGKLKLVTWDIKNSIKKEYILDSNKKQQIYIPPYFLNAHQCLSEECILFYKWTEYYNGPEGQWTVKYSDPAINAQWEDIPIILSERDKNASSLKELSNII